MEIPSNEIQKIKIRCGLDGRNKIHEKMNKQTHKQTNQTRIVFFSKKKYILNHCLVVKMFRFSKRNRESMTFDEFSSSSSLKRKKETRLSYGTELVLCVYLDWRSWN